MPRPRAIPSIPVEIIQEIFRLACVPCKDAPRLGRVTSHFTPLKLSHVCKIWREVAVSDPQLWTSIFFHLPIASDSKPNFKLTELYLERSRNRPLHVDLDIHDYTRPYSKYLLDSPSSESPISGSRRGINESDDPEDSHPLLATIFSNFHRWKTAKLYIWFHGIDTDMWENNLCSKLGDGSPLLESLEVSCDVYMDLWMDPFPPLSSLWTNCPRLTKLAVHLKDVQKSSELVDVLDDMEALPDLNSDPEVECIDPTVEDWVLTKEIPYHQLTHLDLDAGPGSHFTWLEVAQIFGLAQNLQWCSLRGIDRFSEYDEQLPPRVVLEHLEHLYLSSDYNKTVHRGSVKIDIIPSLNETLTAPSLRTLSVDNDNEIWDNTAYTEFITRSDCSLSELHFNLSLENDADDLLAALRLSSATLRVLHSDHDAILGTQFTSAMSRWDVRAGEFDLCPRLEKLVVQVQDSEEKLNPLDRLTKMLMKRRLPPNGSNAVFKMLSIDISRKMAQVARPSLVLLRKHMKLTVGEYHKPISEPVWDREEDV